MKSYMLVFCWIARLIAAVILLQTLYFKFTAAPESVYIFSTVGMEPWGRIGVGVLELLAAVLILVNATVWFGALLAFGLMGGAVVMHLTVLGISVQDDGGYLFFLALMVLFCSLFVLWVNKRRIQMFLRTLYK